MCQNRKTKKKLHNFYMNSRNKRKSTGSIAFSDFNSNDFQNDSRNDLKGENNKNDSDNQNYSPKEVAHVSKVYQNLVTSIMYSMFNPYVSFPEKRFDSSDDLALEDDH